MKFYDSIGPNQRVVRMFAAEKGIALDKVTINLMGGENRQAEYSAKNVTGATPALELADGTMICEITAICEYLEELHPAASLTSLMRGRNSCRPSVARKPLVIGSMMPRSMRRVHIRVAARPSAAA